MAAKAATRTTRRRASGVDIRPDSVREARQAAGLSLAQVANGIVTRAAIHLIERGKARPSLRVLEAIAERTAKPLSFFLPAHELMRLRGVAPASGRLAVAEVELLYERDLYDECLRRASELAERHRDSEHEIVARYWRARALIMTGDARGAIAEASLVVDRLSGGKDSIALAEALDCLASAQYVAQHNDALETARRALEAARTVQPPNPKLVGKVFSHLAAIRLGRHEWDAALEAYEQAAEVLDGLADLARSAQVYEGMSLAYANLGDVAQAFRYCNKAIGVYSARNERLSLASARNNLGWLLLKRGDLGAADAQLRQSLELYESLGVRQRTSHVHLSIGELRLREGRLEDAASAAGKALVLAEALGEQVSAGTAHALIARIADSRGEDAEADRSYVKAISILSSAGATEPLIEAHSSYGELLGRRGDTAKAAAHFRAGLLLARPAAVEIPARSEFRIG